MGRNNQSSYDGISSVIWVAILFFALMPIIGLIWILVKGWDDTPDVIKHIWCLSIGVVGYVTYLLFGSMVTDKFKEIATSAQRRDVIIYVTDRKLTPDVDPISGKITVSANIQNNGSQIYDVEVSSHATILSIDPNKGTCEYSDCSYQLDSEPLENPNGVEKYKLQPHSTTTIEFIGTYFANSPDNTSVSFYQLCIDAGPSEWKMNPSAGCYDFSISN